MTVAECNEPPCDLLVDVCPMIRDETLGKHGHMGRQTADRPLGGPLRSLILISSS